MLWSKYEKLYINCIATFLIRQYQIEQGKLWKNSKTSFSIIMPWTVSKELKVEIQCSADVFERHSYW